MTRVQRDDDSPPSTEKLRQLHGCRTPGAQSMHRIVMISLRSAWRNVPVTPRSVIVPDVRNFGRRQTG
jgi:hypothetical protein